MNILEQIIEKKKREVASRKLAVSVADLQKSAYYNRPVFSLENFLLDKNKNGIIAEFKRKSPSKGLINGRTLNGSREMFAAKVTREYFKHGASALSVLTDQEFFGGSIEDLVAARQNPLPILRKDFIIDEYQVIETKSMGADVILLIAACLTEAQAEKLAKAAKNAGLNVLLEIHNESELSYVSDSIDVVGINNRDLKTFNVDLNRSIELCRKIPAGKIKISESGISNVDTIHYLKQNGFSGFLIGENFMKQEDPGTAFKEFVRELKQI